mmetsp:Transcript_76766/g.115509  ORF Transcript_76766/g.115509 Transcript_76766/m.115509 type:complete len:216 (-) Transcript_76766:360-1007(-)
MTSVVGIHQLPRFDFHETYRAIQTGNYETLAIVCRRHARDWRPKMVTVDQATSQIVRPDTSIHRSRTNQGGLSSISDRFLHGMHIRHRVLRLLEHLHRFVISGPSIPQRHRSIVRRRQKHVSSIGCGHRVDACYVMPLETPQDAIGNEVADHQGFLGSGQQQLLARRRFRGGDCRNGMRVAGRVILNEQTGGQLFLFLWWWVAVGLPSGGYERRG